MFGDSLWALVVVGGFVLLILALLVAKARNGTSAEEDARTEAATRRMYEEQANEDEPRTR